MKSGFSFASWSSKSISDTCIQGTVSNDGGSQLQGSKVDDVQFFISIFASAVYSTAATCEQTSPSPAIQLQ